ncbi:MAG: outer membrane beta-barrel protein [Thiobacillus sp.]
MHKMRLAAAVASALALSTPASAGFFDLTLAPFIGASAGQATSDITCPAATSCDDSDLAWKVYGGLEVNEYLAMEFGYVDMGSVKYSGAINGSRDVSGVTAHLVGTYALTPSFMLIGTGGLNILNAEIRGTIAAPYSSVNDTDIAWSLGLGAQYNLTKSVGLRMEWERYFNVGDAGGTGEADIDLITAGVAFKF